MTIYHVGDVITLNAQCKKKYDIPERDNIKSTIIKIEEDRLYVKTGGFYYTHQVELHKRYRKIEEILNDEI